LTNSSFFCLRKSSPALDGTMAAAASISGVWECENGHPSHLGYVVTPHLQNIVDARDSEIEGDDTKIVTQVMSLVGVSGRAFKISRSQVSVESNPEDA